MKAFTLFVLLCVFQGSALADDKKTAFLETTCGKYLAILTSLTLGSIAAVNVPGPSRQGDPPAAIQDMEGNEPAPETGDKTPKEKNTDEEVAE